MNAAEILEAVAPVIGAAIIAAITALLKGFYDRRDARRQTERRLQLAVARTDFVRAWYEATLLVDDDAGRHEVAAARAANELELAYQEAHEAIEESEARRDEEDPNAFVLQLRRLFGLGPYRDQRTYWISVAIYVAAALTSFLVFRVEDTSEDPFSLDEKFLLAVIYFLIFRGVGQIGISFLERRADAREAGGGEGAIEYVVADEAEYREQIQKLMVDGYHVVRQGPRQALLSKGGFGRLSVHLLLLLPSLLTFFVPNIVYALLSRESGSSAIVRRSSGPTLAPPVVRRSSGPTSAAPVVRHTGDPATAPTAEP